MISEHKNKDIYIIHLLEYIKELEAEITRLKNHEEYLC